MLAYQQSVFKRYRSDKHFSEFLPTRWRQKVNWHRYGTKLRYCHRMYRQKNQTVTVSECCLIKLFRCILFENRSDSGPGAKNVPSSRFCCVSTEWRWLRDDTCMFICFATMPACDGQTGGRRIAAHSALCRIASCGNDDKRAYITPHGSSAARLHSSVARSNSD